MKRFATSWDVGTSYTEAAAGGAWAGTPDVETACSADDNSFATANMSPSNGKSKLLKLLGFSTLVSEVGALPSRAVITGTECEMILKGETTDVYIFAVRLIVGDATVGDTYAAGTQLTTSEVTYTYGRADDSFNYTMALSDVDSNFGWGIRMENTHGSLALDGFIERIRGRIWYTLPQIVRVRVMLP